jgi:hypothetical protein
MVTAMRSARVIVTVSMLMASTTGFAQSSDPAAANREILGTNSAAIEVQTSANATLDVGGPGASNADVIGGNVRSSLGASPQQPLGPVASPAPMAGLPRYSLESPVLIRDRQGNAPSAKPTADQVRVAEELILPRFRLPREQSGSPSAAREATNLGRYRYVNGQWWYVKPDGSRAYWNGTQWLTQAAR